MIAFGGALLIFARGGIEPDPAFMSDPDAEFNLWSRSLQIFLEHVPRACSTKRSSSGVMKPLAATCGMVLTTRCPEEAAFLPWSRSVT